MEFFAPKASQWTFLGALALRASSTRFLAVNELAHVGKLSLPTKYEPEVVIHQAKSLKLIQHLPLEVFMGLTTRDPAILDDSRARPGFKRNDTDHHVPITSEAAATMDKLTGMADGKNALRWVATASPPPAPNGVITAASYFEAAEQSQTKTRTGLLTDVLGLSAMTDPNAYLDAAYPPGTAALNQLITQVDAAIDASPLARNDAAGQDYDDNYPTVPASPANGASRAHRKAYVIALEAYMTPTVPAASTSSAPAPRPTTRKEHNDAQLRLEQAQRNVKKVIDALLPGSDLDERYPGLPLPSTHLSMEALSRLADLIELQLNTLADLNAHVTASAVDDASRERATMLTAPTIGTFATSVHDHVFGSGLAKPHTATIFEIYTRCINLPALFVWAAYALHIDTKKPTPERIAEMAFADVHTSATAYGVGVAQLLNAVQAASDGMTRYNVGSNHSIILIELKDSLRRDGVGPASFKATGNEQLLCRLLLDPETDFNDVFYREIVDGLRLEHKLVIRCMGASPAAIAPGSWSQSSPTVNALALALGSFNSPTAPPTTPPTSGMVNQITPPPPTPGPTPPPPSLAAAQPPVAGAPQIRGYHTGKMTAKACSSSLDARWITVYDDLFADNATWATSQECYVYFNSQ